MKKIVILTTIVAVMILSTIALVFKYTGGTCSAGKNCTACSNCKYCKNCSKDGGTCSVCN